MHEERAIRASDSIEMERQASRIRVSQLFLIFSFLQSAIFGLFALAGSIFPWVALVYLVLCVGSALGFWIVLKLGLNCRWEHKDIALHQCVAFAGLQLIFIFLAPKLTFLLLLAMLVVFAYGMVQLTYYHFAVGWLTFALISGIALWCVRDRFAYPGESGMQIVLVWLFYVLTLAALVQFRTRNDKLQDRITEANEKLLALQAKLDALARHDMLTGALNRQAMIEALDAELLRAKRTGHPFCFAVIDLDRFRAVNEKYGNETGDVVLKTISEIAIKLLRALDRFGRLGGEEFGIVLPATWLDQGVIALGRLTKAVAEGNWNEVAPSFAITFSAGITTNAVNDTAETIIKRADEALIQAKNEGRNRIVQAEEALPDMPPVDID